MEIPITIKIAFLSIAFIIVSFAFMAAVNYLIRTIWRDTI